MCCESFLLCNVFPTLNIFSFLALIFFNFKTAAHFSKVCYSLIVLKLPLNPNQSVVSGWLRRRFEALLEREWLQAGHPFGDRCAKSAFANSKLRQESPVFLLFLDCAWQVQRYVCLPISFALSLRWLHKRHLNLSHTCIHFTN